MSRPPVDDWSLDFDHFDTQWTEDPFQLWASLRRSCSVLTSQRFEDGAFLPLTYADVHAIAYDTEHFSSKRIVVREQKLPIKGMPPITSDPPAHTPSRRILLPPFAPQEVQKLEPRIRGIASTLLDDLEGRTDIDAAVEYAQHLPVHVIAHLLRIDASKADCFRTWIYALGTGSVHNPEAGIVAMEEMSAYFLDNITQRRATPDDGLISYLITAEIEGKPLTDQHIIGTLCLLLVAGIETTWSAIGASLWHIATHADDRHRLVAEPDLLPTAIEEFLRAYAPVTMAREVVADTTVGGCPYHTGGQVLLSYPAANRDPEKFDNPDTVIIDRAHNPHAAFGLGRHRCLGSNLARLELRVALEEWLARFPNFELAPDAHVVWSEGQLRGPKVLPVRIVQTQG
jgi:cytochrome P450